MRLSSGIQLRVYPLVIRQFSLEDCVHLAGVGPPDPPSFCVPADGNRRLELVMAEQSGRRHAEKP